MFSNRIKNYIENFTQLRKNYKNWLGALLFKIGLLNGFTGEFEGGIVKIEK
ncbi:MAG: hypothetical protein XD44_0231 [Methanobacteriaceae archaeon 41_258]|jgi:hypothetical protein|nr:MAG: hypothetical protein XD44_0231 [Methanobacteriaceae archaeon 41_258]